MRSASTWVLVGIIWFPPAVARAIDGDYATQVATCGFAMQIGVNGALCQGAHIGGGLMVTAAHCVDEPSENPATILFGDDLTNSTTAEYSFDEVTCQLHATWDAQTQTGVDLAVCVIEEALPDVPVVYPMPPDGCEVAYLREVLSDSTCEFQDWSCHDGIPGVEVSAGPTVPDSTQGSGPKRTTDSVIVLQDEWEGSPVMLMTSIPGEDGYNLIAGDSGAPFYFQMPDDSWRLISLHSGRMGGDSWSQAVPPYFQWIENESTDPNYDILPCHTFALGEFNYDENATDCEDELSIAADAPNATWTGDCRGGSGDFGGGADGCGGWPPGILTPPDPWFSEPFAPAAIYYDLVAEVEDDVEQQIIHCREQQIEDAILAASEPYATWGFLQGMPDGYLGLWEAAAYDASVIYDDCST